MGGYSIMSVSYNEKEKIKAREYHKKSYEKFVDENKESIKAKRKIEYQKAKKAKKEYQLSLLENDK